MFSSFLLNFFLPWKIHRVSSEINRINRTSNVSAPLKIKIMKHRIHWSGEKISLKSIPDCIYKFFSSPLFHGSFSGKEKVKI